MYALQNCASIELYCNFGDRAARRSRRSSRALRKTHVSIAASFVKRTIVFDTGALIAGDRNGPEIRAIIRAARDERAMILVPTGSLAKTWRDGSSQANLARLMKNVHGMPALDAIAAVRAGDPSIIVTSDPNDMASLLARGPSRDVLVFSLMGGGYVMYVLRISPLAYETTFETGTVEPMWDDVERRRARTL